MSSAWRASGNRMKGSLGSELKTFSSAGVFPYISMSWWVPNWVAKMGKRGNPVTRGLQLSLSGNARWRVHLGVGLELLRVNLESAEQFVD